VIGGRGAANGEEAGHCVSPEQPVLITLKSSPASDSWGFVGVVSVGEFEAYRTIRAYSTPAEALEMAQHLLADVLGALMAGQEWRQAESDFGHAPLRTELGFGLRGRRPDHVEEAGDVEAETGDPARDVRP
jgi:hypothetical protein